MEEGVEEEERRLAEEEVVAAARGHRDRVVGEGEEGAEGHRLQLVGEAGVEVVPVLHL